MKKITGYLLRECGAYMALALFLPVGIYPLWLVFFRWGAKEQNKTELVRGPESITVKSYNKELRKEGAPVRFHMGKLAFPKKIETYHTVVIGGTGSGKTQNVFVPAIVSCLEQNQTGIVHCSKGDFTRRLFNYENGFDSTQNRLYNPLDPRSVKWTIFNDLLDIMDIDRVAKQLIPERANDRDPNWMAGARDILTGLLHAAHLLKRTRNEELRDIFNADLKTKAHLLRQTPHGAKALNHIGNPDSKMSQSYNSIFLLFVRAFDVLEDGPFSINQRLDDDDKGFVFLMNNPKYEDTLRPCLALFCDLFATKLISMKEDPKKRVFLFLDEFSALGNLQSIIRILRFGRSYGAAVMIGVQELGQLERTYGREDTQSIVGGCNNTIFMRTNDPTTNEEISRIIGDAEVTDSEHADSGGVGDYRDGLTITHRKQVKRLALASEIKYQKQCHAFLIFHNMTGPIKTDISARRLYMEETKPPAQLVNPFILRPGLSLEDIQNRERLLRFNADVAEDYLRRHGGQPAGEEISLQTECRGHQTPADTETENGQSHHEEHGIGDMDK